MARFLYINPDPSTQARATQLGCGWFSEIPQDLVAAVAGRTPCAVVTGAGIITVLPEPTTPAGIAAAAQPILNAEAAAVAAQAALDTNAQTLRDKSVTAVASNITFLGKTDPTAANNTYIALASPSTAQQTAQVKALTQQMNAVVAQNVALTRQVNALIKLAQGLLTDVNGT